VFICKKIVAVERVENKQSRPINQVILTGNYRMVDGRQNWRGNCKTKRHGAANCKRNIQHKVI